MVEAQATSIADFCRLFLGRLDRPVIDRTGLAGRYNFRLVYRPEDADSANPENAPGQSIFAALQQQLGLRLEPAKGPGDFLVIDQVSRPSAN
jgi:uncharacterized protein (TIGR03435 family)